MKKLALVMLLMLVASSVYALEIKIAAVAPEGSTWINVLKEWDADLKKQTAGRVSLKIYPGGVAGDEKDVIRKMRIGQLHAGGFTGVGLGSINPNVRILELPMFFNNYDEVDYVVPKIQGDIEKGFLAKGYVLLGWAEAGFVNIFSNSPIASEKDMQGMKMWAWEGDPLVESLYSAFKIVPVPLSITDVMTSLQTKMINAVYAPPLGAIAMQWFAKTKYITDLNLVDSTGAVLMSKSAFDQLSAADQAILKSTAHIYCKKLIERTRKENKESLATLQSSGLVLVAVKPADKAQIAKASEGVWQSLVGQLYPQSLLDKAKTALAEYRSSH